MKKLLLVCDRHPNDAPRQAVGRIVVQQFGSPAITQDICHACLEQLSENFSNKPQKHRQLEKQEFNLLTRKLRRLLKTDPNLKSSDLRKHLGLSLWHMNLLLRHARKVRVLVKGRKIKLT